MTNPKNLVVTHRCTSCRSVLSYPVLLCEDCGATSVPPKKHMQGTNFTCTKCKGDDLDVRIFCTACGYTTKPNDVLNYSPILYCETCRTATPHASSSNEARKNTRGELLGWDCIFACDACKTKRKWGNTNESRAPATATAT